MKRLLLIIIPAILILFAFSAHAARLDLDGGVLQEFRFEAGLGVPMCDAAQPSIGSLWPPNRGFHEITVVGVTDPDGDAITITVNGIYQDEAVDAPGSGNTAPDGRGVGTSVAEVRAELTGGGNGRVYHVAFTADDGNGGTCTGEILVGVPHDKKDTAVDDGPLYDSTVIP